MLIRRLAPALLLVGACSSTPTQNPPPSGGMDATTSTRTDGRVATDGTVGGDGANLDATSALDAFSVPECAELELCCATLPAILQQTCENAAMSGNANQCTMALNTARDNGQCGGDAGSRGDGGPLGPICTELSMCCPSLGALAAVCDNIVNRGDEARCDQTLTLARNNGACQTSSTADGGLGDIGTSTRTDGGRGDGAARDSGGDR